MFRKFIILCICIGFGQFHANCQQASVTSFVDPLIGSEGGGNVFVGPCCPFGIIKPGPDCNLYSNSGYEADLKYPVLGFSQTHVSGTGGGAKYGNIAVMPYSGSFDFQDQSSLRENEIVRLGYYGVKLKKWDIETEITATEKVAFYRFRYNKQGDSIRIYAVSEKHNPTEAIFKISLINFSGKVIKTETKKVTLPANTSSVQYALNEKEWLKGAERKSVVLNVQLLKENEQLAVNNYFFEKSKDLNLPLKPLVKVKQIDATHIEVSTDKLARFVWLNLPNTINAFSDNYFDLLPGEKKVIGVKAPFKMKEIRITTLTDVK